MFCFFLLTGYKPESCKEQPSAPLSVQRGQAVETAAGTVCQCVIRAKETKQRKPCQCGCGAHICSEAD